MKNSISKFLIKGLLILLISPVSLGAEFCHLHFTEELEKNMMTGVGTVDLFCNDSRIISEVKSSVRVGPNTTDRKNYFSASSLLMKLGYTFVSESATSVHNGRYLHLISLFKKGN